MLINPKKEKWRKTTYLRMRKEDNAWFHVRRRKRREDKERETGVWEKKKEKDEVSLSRFWYFILVFIDGQLNINIFNIFVSDSVCKVK